MRFRVSKLIHAIVGARQTESFASESLWLDDELRVDSVKADLVFTRMNDSVMVEGTINAVVRAQCVRSLEMFDLPITTDLDDVFFALPHRRLTETPLEDDALNRISDDGFVDLTEPVREHIIMAMPLDPISPAFRDDQQAQANMDAILGEDAEDWLKVNWSDKK